MKVIHENCYPKLAQDKKLPYTAYLVEYVKEVETNGKKSDKTCYDITLCQKQVDMFDHYYDKYKNVKGIEYGSGTIPPNRFGLKPPPKKKGKTVRGK